MADIPSVGKKAPSFSLPGIPEGLYELSDYLGHYVVLYFYPKDNTPGCTTEACDFRDNYEKLKNMGVVILGISPDSPSSHLKFADKHSLPFPLLSDEGHAVADKYGVWVEKNMYGKKSWGIQRATFVIDPQGIIAAVWPKVKVEGHVHEVMQTLSDLKGKHRG